MNGIKVALRVGGLVGRMNVEHGGVLLGREGGWGGSGAGGMGSSADMLIYFSAWGSRVVPLEPLLAALRRFKVFW